MRRIPSFLHALVLATALAIPVTPARAFVLSHGGYVLDASEQPISATLPMRFRVFPAATAQSGETALWDSGTVPCPQVVREGFYSVNLGLDCGADLPPIVFGSLADRYLEVVVDGVTMLPRQRLTAVTPASRAGSALAIGSTSGALATLGSNGRWPASTLDLPENLVSTGSGGRFDELLLPARVALLDGAGHVAANTLPDSVPLLDAQGKLALSTLPSGPTGLDSASVGGHTPDDATTGDARLALRDALGLLHADRVGSRQAGAAVAPGRLLALDANGKLPASILSGTGASGNYTSVSVGAHTLDEDSATGIVRPVQLSPGEAAYTGSTTPTLSWRGAAPFRVQIANAATPGTPVWSRDTSARSYTVDVPLTTNTAYVWRVLSLAAGTPVASPDRALTLVAPITLTGTVAADATRTTLAASVLAGASQITTAANPFTPGDVLVIVALQGTGSGLFDYARLVSAAGNVLTLSKPLRHGFLSTDKVVVQRALRGGGVTVNGTVNASTWNGTTGGVVAIWSEGDLTLGAGAAVNVDGLGYAGGAWRASCSGVGAGTPDGAGESIRGTAGNQNARNAGGGGGSLDGCAVCTGGGGGGGHGTAGGQGGQDTAGSACYGGDGGDPYGDPGLETAYFGSGGGAGSNAPSNGGAGGRGGGIVLLFASGKITTTAGTVSARGLPSPNGNSHRGGGGAGGTILAIAPEVVLGTVDVTGGAGLGTGAAGGLGRLKTSQIAP